MKIKNVKKFIRSIFLIMGMILIICLFIGKSSYSHKEVEYKTICISQGDTLWTIAKTNQIGNSYYKGKDIRYIIKDLIKINNLKNSNININQNIIIPVL